LIPAGRLLRPANRDNNVTLSTDQGDQLMKWETPTACDFRFGFEIAMYIDAR
jgi:coenzyme PQQ precursor peptide PqqA